MTLEAAGLAAYVSAALERGRADAAELRLGGICQHQRERSKRKECHGTGPCPRQATGKRLV